MRLQSRTPAKDHIKFMDLIFFLVSILCHWEVLYSHYLVLEFSYKNCCELFVVKQPNLQYYQGVFENSKL